MRPLASLSFVGSLLLAAACGSASTPTPPQDASQLGQHEPVAPSADWARGGRLFDNWIKESGSSFKPDAKATAGVADGQGGPHGNGTLKLHDGSALLNDGGHDYRLKNFYGWDLRGQSGLYGKDSLDKSTALADDLLSWEGDVHAVAQRLTKGEGSLPALGDVLAEGEINALAAFVVGVRDGQLPRASDVWNLAPKSQGGYTLREGGDAARGKTLYAERCAGCHGDDGTAFLIDDGEFSLGSHARQKGYEDWFKILAGQPGTPMKSQVRGATASEKKQEILDLLTALCDRSTFPLGKASKPDVADGDARCGAALKP